MSVLAIFFISLFCWLGVWQLQRAQEKQLMLAAEKALAHQPSREWHDGQPMPLQYQPIKISGTFLHTVFLLDNQHQNHQFGYDVLSPLLLANGRVVLVDRGWVAGEVTRQAYPVVKIPSGRFQLTGATYYPSGKNWSLGPLYEKIQHDLVLVELLDTNLVGRLLHKSVYPFIMRLGKDEAHGYIRHWTVVSMMPQRHQAYAVQWFAMALIIFVLYLVLNVKKKT